MRCDDCWCQPLPSLEDQGMMFSDACVNRRCLARDLAIMTEQEWLECRDFAVLRPFQDKISDRKWRLFGCACCRRI